MSAETALVIGLASVVYLTIKLVKELEEAENSLRQGSLVGSMLFLISLLYTGYGIAQGSSVAEAERAYLASLILVVLVFLGLVVRLFQKYKKSTSQSELEGFN